MCVSVFLCECLSEGVWVGICFCARLYMCVSVQVRVSLCMCICVFCVRVGVYVCVCLCVFCVSVCIINLCFQSTWHEDNKYNIGSTIIIIYIFCEHHHSIFQQKFIGNVMNDFCINSSVVQHYSYFQ